ncbi:MAG: ABC transporter substrate-binding protein [Acidimicrobiales bacterium]
MKTIRRGIAAAAGLLLVASACGGDDGAGDDVAAGTTQPNEVAEEVNKIDLGGTTSTTAGASDTTTKAPAAYPSTMQEWEALWEEERAAVVERITENGWGLQADGKTVTGPEGFTIDLSQCAAGFSNTEGITDTEIKIGSHTALSGTLADGGNIMRAGQVVMDHYNKAGFFQDSEGKKRSVNLIIKDDGYDPARTIPIVDELLDSEKVFAVWGLGSGPVMKTYDKLNQRCVPHPFEITGHPAWGDPVNHPWTTGILLAYNTEATLWGAFIDQHIDELTAGDGKATIAGLIMNNDFGKAYEIGFKAWLATTPNKDKIEFVSETIEPQAPTVTDPMTNLAAKRPDMFIQMLAGTPCAQTITEVAQNGMKEETKFLMAASVCRASTYTGRDAVGDASEGWWIMGGGARDVASPAEDDTAYIVWARELLASGGYDYKSSGNLGFGVGFGWMWVQVLEIAGQLPGGLTRANLITAVRATEMTAPMYLEGIKWNMNGNADAYWLEGTEVGRYDVAKQTFVQQGDIIDLSGKSSNCAWDQSSATCR